MPVAADPIVDAVTFAFGEILLRFESSDRTWLGFVERRFRRFAREDAGAAFVVRFEPASSKAPAHLVSPLAVHLESVRCHPANGGFRIETETTQGFIDLSSAVATVRGPRAMYPIDNLLRHLLPILWNRGVLLHAAAIELRPGTGFLASGASGSGKTTLARLWPEGALCDELAAVAIEENVRAVGLPFWESRPGSFSLRALLHLQRGPEHRLDPLPPGEALRKLTTQVLWPVWEEASMSRAFSFLAEFVDRVPAFDFSFHPTADVRAFLRKELG